MSLSSLWNKVSRLAEDEGAEGAVTLAELILGSEEMRQEDRNVETLVAFARELAGTRPERPAEPSPVVAAPPPSTPVASWERFTREGAWNPAPLLAPARDEKSARAELIRQLRRKMQGYQLSTYEGMKLRDQYPELNTVENWVEPATLGYIGVNWPRATDETTATVEPDDGDKS